MVLARVRRAELAGIGKSLFGQGSGQFRSSSLSNRPQYLTYEVCQETVLMAAC